MKKKRSKGVTFFAVINILIGALNLLGTVIILGVFIHSRHGWQRQDFFAIIPISIFLFLGLAYFIQGLETFRLNPRARRNNISLAFSIPIPIFLFIALIWFISDAISIPLVREMVRWLRIDFTLPFLVILLVWIIWYLVNLIFFTRRSVKEQFNRVVGNK